MRYLSVLVILSMFLMTACSYDKNVVPLTHMNPTVLYPFLGEYTFTVTQEPVAVRGIKTTLGMSMCKLAVERNPHPLKFAALVIPCRTIKKGDQVELVYIEFYHNRMTRTHLLLVKR